MIDETISKIEERIRQTSSLREENRSELLELMSTLKGEVRGLSQTHGDDAQSIAQFTDLSAREAVREGGNPKVREISLEGLAASVDGFETSHPKLVQLVNRICTVLSNLGV